MSCWVHCHWDWDQVTNARAQETAGNSDLAHPEGLEFSNLDRSHMPLDSWYAIFIYFLRFCFESHDGWWFLVISTRVVSLPKIDWLCYSYFDPDFASEFLGEFPPTNVPGVLSSCPTAKNKASTTITTCVLMNPLEYHLNRSVTPPPVSCPGWSSDACARIECPLHWPNGSGPEGRREIRRGFEETTLKPWRSMGLN